ncbi:uncharacterized protein LOC108664564 isoform X2 [Hyalella azteca]|uniref:Uncharacterized protein LOC108664564 isoform X2 n=1 Tax=Hyalella azteca TaxID=294128 RepID=A0A979FLC4_HYAAZ|nr:uncharacterized protein LOC108664564 isoform X2 [Hyalella azteca]
MSDMEIKRRRSPRTNKEAPPLSVSTASTDSYGKRTPGKKRSISSPPSRTKYANCESESQSSNDDEGRSNLSSNLESTSAENEVLLIHTEETFLYAKKPKEQQYSPVEPKKPVRKIKPKEISDLSLTPKVSTMIGLVGILIAIPLLLLFAHLFSNGKMNHPSDLKTLGDIEDDIIRDLEKLRSETKQEMKFWREMYAGLSTLTEQAPRQPVVVLMAVPLDGSRTAVCIAHHLADIVNKAFEDDAVVKHDTQSHLHMPWDEHKYVLDNRLQNLSRSHSALIYNLEKMPPKTATLLHGYFDNDNAPHKRALMLVLLELELHYASVAESHLDLTVERRLHELWRQDLEPDSIPGLISRVAVQPVLVKPESKLVLDRLCPL